jgi:hypothetical protein
MNIRWISILGEDVSFHAPHQSDAQAWAGTYNLDPVYVLYDPAKKWNYGAPWWPSPYLVHTSNMLIWTLFWGWVVYDTPEWDAFLSWTPDYLQWCSEQPGAVAGKQ